MTIDFTNSPVMLLIVLIVFGIAAGPCPVSAVENGDIENGPEMMQLEGGMLGSVPFPHRQHQETADECSTCHKLFPQEPGAIQSLQASGELKKQQVMNSLCIDCHTDRQSAGKPTGPIQCGKCHQR